MNYRGIIIIGCMVVLMLLGGCGTNPSTQSISLQPFVMQLAKGYAQITAPEGSELAYRLIQNEEDTVVQFAKSRIDAGVTVEQMASLNLQKLEFSLPGYEFIEQSSRMIDCYGKKDGEMISFITQQGGKKMFHSQYYTIIDGQGYVWSASSTIDHTRKVIADLVQDAVCYK